MLAGLKPRHACDVSSAVAKFMVSVGGVEASHTCHPTLCILGAQLTAGCHCKCYRNTRNTQGLATNTSLEYLYLGNNGITGYGTVRVFRHNFALKDAIGSHACLLEANMRVTNGISRGSSILLPVSP